MKVNLEELYSLQRDLDKDIAFRHRVNYQNTHSRRLLALMVELGELANETRCFKYWSNKLPSPKAVIMDEYADGLHFLLSLGIPLGTTKFEYELSENEEDLTDQFHKMYALGNMLHDHYDLDNYIKAMQYYLNMAISLAMDDKDIINSYKAKLEVNHKRQETNY